METLGDRLKFARTTAHERLNRVAVVTQTELAGIAGVTNPAISMVERNVRKSLSPEAVLKIAKALKVSASWLISGKGLMEDEVECLEILAKPVQIKEKLSDKEMVELVSEINSASTQILSNASNSLPIGRLVDSLKRLCMELVNVR